MRGSALQFRYLFVTTAEGMQTIDVTHPKSPHWWERRMCRCRMRAAFISRAPTPMSRPARMGSSSSMSKNRMRRRSSTRFTADGKLNDAQDVIVGSTNASLFAYVADGVNGLKVVQLTSPDSQPKFYGFSPEPKPQLIAWRKTESAALGVAKGPRPRSRRG